MRALAWVIAPVLLATLIAPVVRQEEPRARTAEITVTEGTSMSVAVSPDGSILAIDLQGTIWTLPATGGRARAITDHFNDARQPSWSPDGRLIAFQGYRDGTYDVWVVAPDGTGLRQLTTGSYDDREPVWSHDGARVAFASDRGTGTNYDIWVLDVRSSAVRQVTREAGNEFMPTWSPDDSEIAFVSSRSGGAGIWAVSLANGTERKLPPAPAQANAPSWGPGGQIVYHVTSRQEMDGQSLTGEENAFPFRVSWSSPREFFYTADGKIRKRTLGNPTPQTIEFSATLTVTPASYTRRVRDFDSRAPRRAVGIVAPKISPDGRTVAFAALGDLWTMRIGEVPRNLTNDRHLETEPAWSPDGTKLAYASDKGGGLLNLWVRDVATGAARQLTRLETSAMAPAWSPDGTRIAFLDVDGIWRRANVKVVEVATGQVTQIREPMFGPGSPTWSSDGKRVAVAALAPYSSRFREGTNQILTIPAGADAGGARWHTLDPHFTIDSRVGAGPVWSPDGTQVAVVSGGLLLVIPVGPEGAPRGPARALTTELAHAPSWTGDSRQILYQSNDKLRMVDVATGRGRDVPLDLTYTLAVPTTRVLVHAGRLVDGLSPTARADMDILIEGNRVRSVEPHRADRHTGITVVDASGQSVMPGLIEFHTHLQKDFGEAQARAWLAFGITTVRSPGGTPYEAAEDREAIDAGVRAGPRIFATGYLMEWQRSYYKMSVAVQNERHLEMELERARSLQLDLLKSYVRMPDLQQRRIIQFAHEVMGVPAASHEVYPSALSGIDGVEHTTGTSRRGYSPKVGPQGRSYSDVSQIVGAADMSFTPTLGLANTWLREMVLADPAMKTDARLALQPPWMRTSITDVEIPTTPPPPPSTGGAGQMIMAMVRAGARVVAGTDTPNPASLHGELAAYVASGMTPFEALRSATVTSAQALRLDAGSIEPGKLADLVVVDGNPLVNIWDAHRVRTVIANGRVFPFSELVAR
jgi:Tol biopolymer transport system component